MKLRLERTSTFREDFALQALWYVREAGPDVVRRYEEAVDATLELLSREPLLGRVRRFRHPKLQGLRSFVVQRAVQHAHRFPPHQRRSFANLAVDAWRSRSSETSD